MSQMTNRRGFIVGASAFAISLAPAKGFAKWGYKAVMPLWGERIA